MAINKRTQPAEATTNGRDKKATFLHQSTLSSSSTSSSHSKFVDSKLAAVTLSVFHPIEFVSELLFNHAHIWKLAGLLLLGEILLNLVIIKKIPYTEIDWIAYMQEVSGYLKGETDYMKLRGDTGPLVYPAGFVYVYSALYYLTDLGTDILKGQWIFMGLYLLTLGVVFSIYATDKTVMRWTLSSTLFSLAVSVKMNILLFFPAFGFLTWQTQGVVGTIAQLIIMVLIQVLLSLPFTLHHPESYLRKAFEFSRVFQYKWTVNWKFLDEKTFLSEDVAKLLLTGHLVVLFASEGGIVPVVLRGLTASKTVLSIHARYMKANHVLTLLFTSNFIGIVFARSLHYQFYAWMVFVHHYTVRMTGQVVPVMAVMASPDLVIQWRRTTELKATAASTAVKEKGAEIKGLRKTNTNTKMSLPHYINTIFSSENFLLITKTATIASMGIAAGTGLSYNAMIMPSLAKIAPMDAVAVWCGTAIGAMTTQVSAIAISVLGGSYVYYRTKNRFYLYGSMLMLSILPYTAVMFLPINSRLFEMNRSGVDDGTVAIKMQQWNKNQYGRVFLNVAALVVTLLGTLHVKGKTA
ncbi:dolichyl-P-Man:Man(5)GlcNAc(2)-PP-dolichol alpha-1,3-mannosyltransferase [Dissophora ornata]|nr:dolichyl-P-Man:Man(5)GlcNAc(2)-PP-dolichol alpha-1,3-mannosyltransferase [Dissophora ornata]